MVEEDAVGEVHAVGLTVVDEDPEGVLLGHGVGGAGVEGRGLGLGDLLDLAVELRGGGLVEPARLVEAARADRAQHAEDAHVVAVRSVLSERKEDAHTTGVRNEGTPTWAGARVVRHGPHSPPACRRTP